MDLAETNVLKILLYKDELGSLWPQIADSPIRQLLQLVPLLRLCTAISCDHRCGRFHAAVEDSIDQVIHEVWGRRFQSMDGKSKPFLRIATPALDELLRVAVDGVYFEPRAAGTRATDPDYSVIWLPGANRDAAVHRLKLTTHGLSLVRTKGRFGIRVIATYEEAAHRDLRPGETFVKVDVTRIYRLHPLPHGLQRQQVLQTAAAISRLSRRQLSGSGGRIRATSECPPGLQPGCADLPCQEQD